MKCKKCGMTMRVIGKHNYVCPNCGYRYFKRIYPEMHYKVKIPNEYTWAQCSLSNLSSNNNILTIDSGQISGSIITPQITNISVKTERKKDITKVILLSDYTLNDGNIRYYASNDGGSHYIEIVNLGKAINSDYGLQGLNHGKKDNQSYYYDLRIKVILSRSSISDTSPQLKRLTTVHNYK